MSNCKHLNIFYGPFMKPDAKVYGANGKWICWECGVEFVPKVEPGRVIPWCPECGPNPRCDEDGCCVSCGNGCGEIPDYITLQAERDAALSGIEQWTIASGLNAGTDPSGITPDIARQWWERVERERDAARAECKTLSTLVDKLQQETSDLCDYQAELLRKVNAAECKEIDVTQRCERWKSAAQMLGGYCVKREQTDEPIKSRGIMLGFEAMRDGDLEALEKALGVKP